MTSLKITEHEYWQNTIRSVEGAYCWLTTFEGQDLPLVEDTIHNMRKLITHGKTIEQLRNYKPTSPPTYTTPRKSNHHFTPPSNQLEDSWRRVDENTIEIDMGNSEKALAIAVDTVEKLDEIIQEIYMAPYIAVDCEFLGHRKSLPELKLLQVGVSTTKGYAVQVDKIGPEIIGEKLKPILESQDINVIGWAFRSDALAIESYMKTIELAPVLDLQAKLKSIAMEELNLANAMSQFASKWTGHKVFQKAKQYGTQFSFTGESCIWTVSPLPPRALVYAVFDVLSVIALHEHTCEYDSIEDHFWPFTITKAGSTKSVDKWHRLRAKGINSPSENQNVVSIVSNDQEIKRPKQKKPITTTGITTLGGDGYNDEDERFQRDMQLALELSVKETTLLPNSVGESSKDRVIDSTVEEFNYDDIKGEAPTKINPVFSSHVPQKSSDAPPIVEGTWGTEILDEQPFMGNAFKSGKVKTPPPNEEYSNTRQQSYYTSPLKAASVRPKREVNNTTPVIRTASPPVQSTTIPATSFPRISHSTIEKKPAPVSRWNNTPIVPSSKWSKSFSSANTTPTPATTTIPDSAIASPQWKPKSDIANPQWKTESETASPQWKAESLAAGSQWNNVSTTTDTETDNVSISIGKKTDTESGLAKNQWSIEVIDERPAAGWVSTAKHTNARDTPAKDTFSWDIPVKNTTSPSWTKDTPLQDNDTNAQSLKVGNTQDTDRNTTTTNKGVYKAPHRRASDTIEPSIRSPVVSRAPIPRTTVPSPQLPSSSPASRSVSAATIQAAAFKPDKSKYTSDFKNRITVGNQGGAFTNYQPVKNEMSSASWNSFVSSTVEGWDKNIDAPLDAFERPEVINAGKERTNSERIAFNTTVASNYTHGGAVGDSKTGKLYDDGKQDNWAIRNDERPDTMEMPMNQIPYRKVFSGPRIMNPDDEMSSDDDDDNLHDFPGIKVQNVVFEKPVKTIVQDLLSYVDSQFLYDQDGDNELSMLEIYKPELLDAIYIPSDTERDFTVTVCYHFVIAKNASVLKAIQLYLSTGESYTVVIEQCCFVNNLEHVRNSKFGRLMTDPKIKRICWNPLYIEEQMVNKLGFPMGPTVDLSFRVNQPVTEGQDMNLLQAMDFYLKDWPDKELFDESKKEFDVISAKKFSSSVWDRSRLPKTVLTYSALQGLTVHALYLETCKRIDESDEDFMYEFGL